MYISDVALAGLTNIISGLTGCWQTFLASRLFAGSFVGGCATAFTLVGELVGDKAWNWAGIYIFQVKYFFHFFIIDKLLKKYFENSFVGRNGLSCRFWIWYRNFFWNFFFIIRLEINLLCVRRNNVPSVHSSIFHVIITNDSLIIFVVVTIIKMTNP